MMRQTEIDHSTLNWVNRELDQTLAQSAEALERFAEDNDDTTQLQFCVNHLHQVHGILQMLELHGAVMLTEEMEALATTLLHGGIRQVDEAAESLMKSILRLRDYLDRVGAGQRDAALLILPLVNELRAARGEAIITESALFAPDLAVEPGERDIERVAGNDLDAAGAEARTAYQRGLLGVIRGKRVPASLQRMIDALDSLDAASPDEATGRPWWLTAGLLEALRDGSLADYAVAARHLLGQIERHLKRPADGLPEGLLRGILYYVSRAEPTTERLERLHAAYGLQTLHDEARRLEEAREGLFGPDASAFHSVAEAIREDLAGVKDALDLYIRGSQRDVDALHEAAGAMRRIADTLGVLGLAEARRVVRDQADIVGELSAEGGNDLAVEKAAEALLYVESSLRDLGRHREPDEDASPDPADSVFASEYREVFASTLAEAIAEVGQIKEGLIQFLESHDPDHLDGLDARFARMRGALTVIELERAAALVGAADRYVGETLLARGTVPDAEALDDLADAITSVEYYLEAVRDGRAGTDQVLDVAENGLRRLGYTVEPAGDAAVPEVGGDGEVDWAATDPEVESVETPEPAGADGDAAAGGDRAPAAIDFSQKRGRVNLEVPVRSEELDEEILEIFIEEADEVLETLSEVFPRWRDNPEDQDALLTTRRMFHTLKGSGRLAGALLLGELAWSVENLLNRVLDRTLEPGRDVPDIVEEAMRATPELVDELRGGTAPTTDVRGLMRRAAALSDPAQGEEPSAAPAGAPPVVEPGEEATAGDEAVEALASEGPEALQPAAEPEIEPDGPAMDPTLYEIFSKETLDHLAIVSDFLAQCESGACRASEELVRSLHTLTGSARMADVRPIARLGRALEQLARARQNAHRPLDDDDQDCLARGAAVIREVVAALGEAGTPLPDVEALVEEAERHRQGIAAPSLEALAWTGPDADPVDADWPAARDEPIVAAFPEPVASVVPPERDDDGAWQAQPAAAPEPIQAAWVETGPAPVPPPPSPVSPPWSGPGAAGAEPLPSGAHVPPAAPPSSAPSAAADPMPPADYPVAMADGAVAARVPDAAPTDAAEAPSPEPLPAGGDAPAAEAATGAAPADDELTQIFLEEAQDILGVLDESVERWGEAPEHGNHSTELHRSLHTLKGGARLAGFDGIGRFCHALESLITDVADSRVSADDAFFDVLRDCVDELVGEVEAASAGANPQPDEALLHRIAELRGGDAAAPVPDADEAPPDQELLDVFLEEGAEILRQSEALLHRWRGERETEEYVRELERALHTLKGGARMAGLQAIADLSHALETLLRRVAGGETARSDELFDVLERANDRLIDLRDAAAEGRTLNAPNDLQACIAALQGVEAPAAAARLAPEPEPAGEPEPVSPRRADAAADGPVDPSSTAAAEDGRRQADAVRVRSDLLDNLVNYAGEVSIYRARLEQQAGSINFNLDEFGQTVSRLREQLRSLEIETETQILHRFEREVEAEASRQGSRYDKDFDPLEMDRFSRMQELSRALSESVNDLSSIEATLGNLNRETETLLLQQSRVNTDLQDGLMRTRMVPFANLVPRMRRIVRQASQDLGKQASLKVLGAEGEMDRTVLERVVPPLEHMLRNAVAHGIEEPGLRAERGKPEGGAISVSLDREGADVVIRVNDDGGGMDLEAIRRKAMARGLMRDGSGLTDREVMQFVLESGFSTAEQVTQIAGRGVGMDVVNAEIKQLGGSLEIDSVAGSGTRFTIRLPFTLALNQAILCNAGEEVYAIPLSSIEGVVRMDPGTLREHLSGDGSSWYEYAGSRYEVRSLAALLGAGDPQVPEDGRRAPLILVQTGEHRMALQVDGLIGSRDIVVKSVGLQISTVPGIFGATILADGRVVLILDVSSLVRFGVDAGAPAAEATASPPTVAVPGDRRDRPQVMVVDDSITMRKVASRLLERNNMSVVTAKDGVDAVAALQETVPDAMLLDIEMPRMDGYELATHMRNDERLRDVPIVMITSRTGEKHRQRALDIGVDRYLGKPYQESDLLETLQSLIEHPHDRFGA